MEKLIYSSFKNGCGLASLKMLLVHLQGDKNYSYYQIRNKQDLSLEGLRKIALEEGVALTWKKVSNKEAILENKTFPLLLLFEKEGKKHLVYYLKRKRNKHYIYDPEEGKIILSNEELLSLWEGTFGEGKKIEKKSSPFKKIKFIPFYFHIGAILLSLICGLSLLGAFYFMDGREGKMPLFTIIFFALFGLSLISNSLFYRFYMKKFDNKYLKEIIPLRRIDNPSLEENYKHYYSFKTLFFKRYKSIYEGLIAIFLLVFLFGYNDPSYLISVGALLIFEIVSLIFFFKPLKQKEKQLEKAEYDLLKRGRINGTSLEFSIKKIALDSEKLFTILQYENVIKIAWILAISLLPPLFNNRFELNYYLFGVFVLISFHEAFNSFFNGSYGKKSLFEKEEAYFLAHFIN